MNKICHITSVHNRFDTRIFVKQCVSLANNDYDVTLLLNDRYDDEVNNKVNIISLRTPFNSRIKRILWSKKLLLAKALEIDAEVYQLHDPELLSLGKKLLKNGKKVIFDSHEDVPRQILAKTWIPGIFKKIISVGAEIYENIILKNYSAIIVPTPHLEDRFKKINKCVVQISNFPLISEFTLENKQSKSTEYACYVGGISISRGIKEIAEGTKIANIDLVLCGNFESEELKEEILNKYEHITYKGQVGRKEVSEVINDSLVGLVVLLPTPNHINSYPIKMFEYMAGSTPVIASNFPLWASIIQDANCGLCVDPFNVEEIANKINYLKDNKNIAYEMGTNGRRAVIEKYNWSSQELKLIELYKNILGGKNDK